ncbi:PKD domain-containing protein [Desulfoluna limicola]|uniref:PKD domain-containing protein n=1 Tax=Desulfoluna limicola TaxID=2810562 RepID=UPI001F30B0DC|nr:PKD domain-containing protein [Desulfoluna limicola]
MTLDWTPCTIADHYVVYWGTTPGTYTQFSQDILQPSTLPDRMPHTVTDLTDGVTYHFAVKAFNASGQSTNYSNEITATVGSDGPVVSNSPPTANAGPDQSVPETTNDVPSLITLDGSASTDADGTITAYHWARVDPYTDITTVLSSATAAQPSFNAPAVASSTPLIFRLTVTDNDGATATDLVQVTITNVNKPPTANAGPDQTQPETTSGTPTPITLNGAASTDSDGTISSYRWTRSDPYTDIPITLSSATIAQPSFNAPSVTSATPFEFTLTVADNEGATATDQVRITITNVNQPPTASAGPDQTQPETTGGHATLVTLDGTSSSDNDGTISAYQWVRVDSYTGTPTTLSSTTAAQPTFTAPSVTTDTPLEFRLTVTDNDGAKATDQVQITITNVNIPPTANAGPNQTRPETTNGNPTTVTLNGSASEDPDGVITQYSWRRSDGLSDLTTTLQNPYTATPFFVSPDIQADTPLEFELTVTDTIGATAYDTVLITLTRVNQIPFADPGPNQTVNEQTTVRLSGANSSDADGTLVSWRWEQVTDAGGPVVSLSGATTETATFTAPDVGTEGESLTFRLTVTDNDGATHSATTLVNITFDNQPPVAQAGTDQTVIEGVTVTLSAESSTDPDNDPISSYLWEQTSGPATPLTSPLTAVTRFTAPDVGPSGDTLTFKLLVTDSGGLSDTDEVIINITFANQPPVADAGPDQGAYEGNTLTLTAANSSDPDDGISTYRWSQTDGPPVTLSDATAVSPSFVAPAPGSSGTPLTFQLTVTDNGGLSDTDETTVTVNFVNQPPVASAGPDQRVSEGALVTLSAEASHDPDNNLTGYLWEQLSGPSVLLSDTSTAVASFTAPTLEGQETTLLFRVTVTDSYGLTATDTCAVHALTINQAPTANAGADQAVQEGKTVTLDGSASLDPDGDITSWTWTQTTGPSVTLTAPTAPVTHFVAPKSLPGGISLGFTLTVMDNDGLSHSDSCTVQDTFVQTDPTSDTSMVSIEIMDDQMKHLDWLSIGWDSYVATRNEARVASGDLDGDGTQELVVGLGPVQNDSAIPGGFFQIISHDYKHLAWGQIPWAEYNDFNGETWPTCGDLDGDGVDEIVMGLGKGGQGKLAVFTYSLGHVAHRQWASVPWEAYNGAMGETRPACGDIDGDNCMEVIVGLNSDASQVVTVNGRFAVLGRPCTGDLSTPFELKAWGQVDWADYNASNGETWPSSGDIDGDGQDEIILGLGAGGEGKTEIVHYENNTLIHRDWLAVDWNEYNTQNGETRPTCSDINGNGTADIVLGLGPVAENEQLPKGRFPAIAADQSSSQWGQVALDPYNTSNGETRPVALKSNGESLIAIGLGPYMDDSESLPPAKGNENLVPLPPTQADGGSSSGCFINTSR